MSLSSVFNIAQNSLASLTRQSSVLARNIHDSNSPYYARRELHTVAQGSGTLTSNIRRAVDLQLERAAIDSVSANAGQALLSDRLDALNSLLAGSDGSLQITAQLNSLHDSIQTYGANADNPLLGDGVVSEAKDIAVSLNRGTQSLHRFRLDVDKEIGSAIRELNGLIAAFSETNNQIMQGTRLGIDVSDALDRRSALLDGIAEIVPVAPLLREHGAMVLLTTSGATLFETVPRQISFTEAVALAPGSPGSTIHVDAIVMKYGGSGTEPVAGKLDGLLRLRDEIVPSLQLHFDETARSLLVAFAELDATGTGLPPLQGLFMWSGGPAFPPAGASIDGLAGEISVNPVFDTQAGGTPLFLRDGGSNGVSYNANLNAFSAFADRLIGLAQEFDADFDFDPGAGLGTSMSLGEFSARSSAWFSERRSEAAGKSEQTEAKLSRVKETLSNQTGVNIDAEMVKLGEIEKGYQASARLLNAADQMLQSLLDAVR